MVTCSFQFILNLNISQKVCFSYVLSLHVNYRRLINRKIKLSYFFHFDQKQKLNIFTVLSHLKNSTQDFNYLNFDKSRILSESSLQKFQRQILNSRPTQIIRKVIVFLLITHLPRSPLQLLQHHPTNFYSTHSPLPRALHKTWSGNLHLRTLSDVIQTVDRRIRVSPLSHGVFAYIPVLFLPVAPGISFHVVKIDISARIRHVAPNRVRVEPTLMNADIFQRNINHRYSRLGLTRSFLIKRVQHAPRSVSVRFFHLLGTDVNGPPNRFVHGDIFVVYIFDESCASVAGVALDVDAFYGADHLDVPECYVLHAVAGWIWRNAADSHADSQTNRAVLDQEIAGAVGLALGFGDHHIVIVLAGDVVDVEPGACGVDSVGVEGEHGYHSFDAEFFDEVYLRGGVDFDIDVVYFAVVAGVHFEMVLGCVFPYHIVNFGKIRVNHMYQMRPVILVGQVFVGFQQGQNPPMVPSAINFPAPFQLDKTAMSERYEIFVIFAVRLQRPMQHIFRGYQFTNNANRDVVNVLYSNGIGEEFFVGDKHDPVQKGGVGGDYGFEDGAGVGLLVGDCVGVRNGAEVEDVEEGGGEDQHQSYRQDFQHFLVDYRSIITHTV